MTSQLSIFHVSNFTDGNNVEEYENKIITRGEYYYNLLGTQWTFENMNKLVKINKTLNAGFPSAKNARNEIVL